MRLYIKCGSDTLTKTKTIIIYRISVVVKNTCYLEKFIVKKYWSCVFIANLDKRVTSTSRESYILTRSFEGSTDQGVLNFTSDHDINHKKRSLDETIDENTPLLVNNREEENSENYFPYLLFWFPVWFKLKQHFFLDTFLTFVKVFTRPILCKYVFNEKSHKDCQSQQYKHQSKLGNLFIVSFYFT